MTTADLPFHVEESIELNGRAEAVFNHLDDFEKLGEHMMRSSWMMAGSRMRYEFDEARGRESGARVRLMGSVLGLKLEIDERITERTPPLRKSWQTIGHPRMLIIDAYRLGFSILPTDLGCRLTVFIDYSKPRDGVGRWLGKVAGDAYARWCVGSILNTAYRQFGVPPAATVSAALGHDTREHL